MYDVGGTLLGGIKTMYIDSLACVRVKRGVSERFMIDIYIIHVPLAFQWIQC